MAGLELLDNGANLTQIRDTASREIDKLTEDRLGILSEFEDSKKRAQEAIDSLDRA